MRWMSISLFFFAGQPALPGTGALLYIFWEQSGTGSCSVWSDCQIAIGDDRIRKIHSFASLPLRYSRSDGYRISACLTAAAYSSADSALTLFYHQFLPLIYFNTKKHTVPVRLRYLVHAGFSVLWYWSF